MGVQVPLLALTSISLTYGITADWSDRSDLPIPHSIPHLRPLPPLTAKRGEGRGEGSPEHEPHDASGRGQLLLASYVRVVLGHGLRDVPRDRSRDDLPSHLARDVVERAPEPMDGEPPFDPDPFHHAFERQAQVVLPKKTAVLFGEHPPLRQPRMLSGHELRPMIAKRPRELRHQRDRPHDARLGRRDLSLPLAPRHADQPLVLPNVRPAQSGRLTEPQPGERQRQRERIVGRLGRPERVEHLPELIRREQVRIVVRRLSHRKRSHPFRRRARDVELRAPVTHHHLQHPQHVVGRLLRDPFDQPRLPLPHIPIGQLVEVEVTERRQDVAVENPRVGLRGRRLDGERPGFDPRRRVVGETRHRDRHLVGRADVSTPLLLEHDGLRHRNRDDSIHLLHPASSRIDGAEPDSLPPVGHGDDPRIAFLLRHAAFLPGPWERHSPRA